MPLLLFKGLVTWEINAVWAKKVVLLERRQSIELLHIIVLMENTELYENKQIKLSFPDLLKDTYFVS